MGWYKKAFGNSYLKIYSHRNEEEAVEALHLIESVYQPLFDRSGAGPLRILDLACGHGRYSRLLANLGHEVAGVDLSEELLEAARSRLKKEPLQAGNLWFVRADKRHIPFCGSFDLVINMFTSFGYFHEDEENYKVLLSVACALKPGGRFLIDYLNRNQVIDNLVGEDVVEQGEITVKQRRRISPDGLRVEKTIQMEGPRGHDTWSESVRLYSSREMEQMLSQAGLAVQRLIGSYKGDPFQPDSARLILTGSKK
jgi:SAM-dependent methyltransferase